MDYFEEAKGPHWFPAASTTYGGELRDDIESCRRELQGNFYTRALGDLGSLVDDIVRENDRKALKKAYRSPYSPLNAQSTHKFDLTVMSSCNHPPISRYSRVFPEQRPRTSEDALMNANAAVTDTLRRTTQLMHQEIERFHMDTTYILKKRIIDKAYPPLRLAGPGYLAGTPHPNGFGSQFTLTLDESGADHLRYGTVFGRVRNLESAIFNALQAVGGHGGSGTRSLPERLIQIIGCGVP
ncbi:hypothetical protein BS47DRAFT_1369682 [Hydnum rufescens UP504]|uniref:Uncharacterized protein n=1 Tax=Hydnum rufescens UP504 TaxID=1448309 RepID=A0A9P6DLN5_9AGAM|nr:hypothetical protein BS47DRAFT_1369682 [Hydnum rufescens UP504]